MFNRLPLKMRTRSKDFALVAERRSQIMRGAIKVFTQKGFAKAQMREVARESSMSPGLLYHYFGSKDEILYFIIDEATSKLADYLEELADSVLELPPDQAITVLIEGLFGWANENKDVIVFIYQEFRNLPRQTRRQVLVSDGRVLAVFEKFIKKGVELGVFGTVEPRLTAHNIIVVGHSWALRPWFVNERTFNDYLARQLELVFGMLHSPTSRPQLVSDRPNRVTRGLQGDGS